MSARSIRRRVISIDAWLTDQQARTTQASRPMATGPSAGDAPTDIAESMGLTLGVTTKGPDPGPVGARPLQNPDDLFRYGPIPNRRYPSDRTQSRQMATHCSGAECWT